MKLLKHLERNASCWFLIITSAVFFLLRLPSLFEPYWYGDEGIYEVIGFALNHQRLLYSGIWDNKPPMLYLIYAIFNGDQTGAKSLSLIAGLFAVWAIFYLSKKLFTNFLPAAITTGVFAFLFGIPLIEGNIANAENFMLFPGLLAGLLVLISVQTHKQTHHLLYKMLNTKYVILFSAGLLLGISFLIKVVAMFDLSAFAVFVFLVTLDSFSIKDIFISIKKVIPLIVGFIIPIILCTGFFVLHGAFSIFLHSTLLSNVGYVNYGNQFIIPQGFLILKTALVGLVVVFFLIRRKQISPTVLFIFLWIIFGLYAALFSGRPYTHYSLVILPGASLLLGLVVANKKLRIITTISLIVVIFFVSKTFTFYSHPVTYYGNFLQYITGAKSTTAYWSFFDKVTPRDYEISEFILSKKNPSDTIFVWGNSGQIYKLTNTLPIGRFIVAYHMTMTPQNLAEEKKVLQQTPPKFIIVLPNQDDIPYPLMHYQEVLMIDGATIYEHTL